MRRGWVVLLFWRLLNPLMRPLAGVAPWWLLVETTGRRTGRTRRTPLAVGRRETVRYRHRLRWRRATTQVHDWDPDLVATMSRYARSGPRVTARDPLVVQLRPVA